MIAESNMFSTTEATSEIILEINCVPLMRANPSFYRNFIGYKFNFCIILDAFVKVWLYCSQAKPSPIIPSAK